MRAVSPPGIVSTIRQAVRQQDPSLAIQQYVPYGTGLLKSVAPTRLATRLATLFALTSLLLASVGIYGVLAHVVARTRGLTRMAIGATRRSVIGLVLKDGMTWSAAGILVGLIGAFAAATLIAALVWCPGGDPVTFVTVGSAVLLVALAASAIPRARGQHRSDDRDAHRIVLTRAGQAASARVGLFCRNVFQESCAARRSSTPR